MKRILAAIVFFAGTLTGAMCPIGVPVVTVPPQQVAGFVWGKVIQPMGDPCVGKIAVDPANDLKWYVGGVNGLYMTNDGGQTWTHPLGGDVNALLLVPGNPTLVYVGTGTQLYLTRDQGAHWTNIGNYPRPISSIHVVGYTVFVGLGWGAMMPSGVYTSNLGGGFSTFHPFGPGQTGLIVWTITHDPITGNIYAGTEIAAHPQPYHPPFFRSTDGGITWTNVAGTLPWHVIAAAVHPANGYIYAMTEGLGVYGSATAGASWLPPPGSSMGLAGSMLSDPNQPSRLYAGRQVYSIYDGGAFRSVNGGQSFQYIGLAGVPVGGLAVNGNSKKLYAAAYASGVYVASVP
jgi:photosystem II stability/assembly factor-like uncharacterized protein